MDFRPTILGAIAVVAYMVYQQWRSVRRAPAPAAQLAPAPVALSESPDRPAACGHRNRWIAVRSEDQSRVAAQLGLRDPSVANWETGLAAAYDPESRYVFVAPPVKGWVLAIGYGLPEVSDPAQQERWRTFMEGLSAAFGEAQYFATHRVSNYVAWAQFREGRAARVFAQADEPVLIEGEPTDPERDLISSFFDLSAPEKWTDDYWARADLRAPDEEDVFEMAGRWGVSPTEFGSPDLPESTGLAGVLRLA